MKRTFTNYYFEAFIRPRKVFNELLADPRSLKFGFWAMIIMAIVYTLVYVFLVMGGGTPFKPWLDIPLDVYYRYNVWFLAPSMILGWVLAAGVVQLLSKFSGGTGSFENTLVVLGFGISIASWSTGLHDLITSFLGGIHVINQNEYELALNSPTVWRTLLWVLMLWYLLWFVVLFSIGVRVVQGIKAWHSVLVGTIGFVVYQLFFLIFNR